MNLFLKSIVVAACSFVAIAPAQANDCEAKAAQIANRLGATIIDRSSLMIGLQHDAVPEALTIGCASTFSPADGPDINLSWNTQEPSENFWSLAGSAGAIVSDAPVKAVEDGARACYDAARKTRDGVAELSRRGVRYECALLTEHEGSFSIDIFRRDAAKQKEIDREFEKSAARVKAHQ